MDYDQYYRLRRGNVKAFRELYLVELRRMWFICYHITQDVSKAASMLLNGWKKVMERIVVESKDVPKEGFTALVSTEFFKMASQGIESDEDYEALPIPSVSEKYATFIQGIKQLAYEERYLYLLTTFGGLNTTAVSKLMGISFDEARGKIVSISTKAQDTPEIKKMELRDSVYLSTQFKSSDGKPFESIEIPQILIASLEHDYMLILRQQGKSASLSKIRKEPENMKSTAKPNQKAAVKKAGFKYTKPIVITAVVLVVVIAAAIVLPKIFSSASSTRITTYQVEEITYGNVSTTISGSGTLTPVTQETVTSTYAGEVSSVNFTVGDEVAEGDVLAVVTSDNRDEEITAPCDGILIEFPVKVGTEVAVGGSVAMIMGKDGFTMGIAVDELNISSVALGQEVSFAIDAVEGDYTGSVTAISYNGSTSGGTTAYQITATVGYVEGVYPGMSASVEIVIEDSGDGLLVPVDAVGTSGDDNYVYLAPSGAEVGASFDEGEIDLNDLTKVTVETGMSDGSYMMIESDELAEGNLIVVTKITSTLTGSDSEGEGGGFEGMGEFPGGMDFGDFDFENFDPSQFPQGGGEFPGMGN
ncbi:efflux RND transporter periplasmic adaptor subunit [Parabacteroides johnsonii]|uniref:efflux RND transporter periplasmic adaptor subunit n=1 Tax=Parabacteroides johnsonii TaxID=387661 RepID=UPI00242BF232|nr:biotin/lipoyl-containing protein [Parabacteroides johnsonii]MBS6226248.1 HlyD family efflux transporter periplasmic adaptor subunit [Parabacteroides johnsonii]